MPPSRGVYFLASDGVLELATAFLNSFRTYNPTVSLCLIPFDDDIERLERLHSRYRFSLWPDIGVLRRCDEISLTFHDSPKAHYRKLAIWEGPYEEFLYIDCDTVILGNIDFVFRYLHEFAFVVATSNIRGRAWKESIHESNLLRPEQAAYAANTGFIASKRESLTLGAAVAKSSAALKLKPHMKLGYDQPFLNYLMVTSGLPYTSLRELRRLTENADLPGEVFAWQPGAAFRDGQVVHPESYPVLFVHWTEPVKPTQEDVESVPLYELWYLYRHLHDDGPLVQPE